MGLKFSFRSSMLASESAPLALSPPPAAPLLCRLFLSCFLRLDEDDEDEDDDEDREERDDDLEWDLAFSPPPPPTDPGPLDLLLWRRRRFLGVDDEDDDDEELDDRDDDDDSSPEDELSAAAAFFFFFDDVVVAVVGATICPTGTRGSLSCWAEAAPIGCLFSGSSSRPLTPLVSIAWLSDFWNASGRLFAGCWRMNRL